MTLVSTTISELFVGIVYLVCQRMLKPFGPYRIVAHEGGTRSGKTYNIILFLIDLAKQKPGLQITVCSRDLPHLRKGAMKDFEEIMTKRGLWNNESWKETGHTYTFPNNSYIEFMGADDLGKVSGPGRDVLYCNEVNFFKYIVFRQLLLRTRLSCIVDYNPIHPRHWVYDKVLTRRDCYMWNSTYLDNLRFLPKEQIDEIKMMAETDPEWARIYVEGKRGTLQKGQIYKTWKPITIGDFNRVDAKEVLGVDWGFFPDPNAVVSVKWRGNERFVRKILYKNNMSDEQLVHDLRVYGFGESTPVCAPSDSGGSKAIMYFRQNGFPLTYAVPRPPGSLNNGIKALRSADVHYVMDNDMDFEVGNYCYMLDPNEELTNVPIDKHNHLLDAVRMVELYRPYL